SVLVLLSIRTGVRRTPGPGAVCDDRRAWSGRARRRRRRRPRASPLRAAADRSFSRVHDRGIVGGADPPQRQFDALSPAGPGAVAEHVADGIGRATGVSLYRQSATVERAARAAVRRDRVRNAVHVLFDLALAAAGQRIQRRLADR